MADLLERHERAMAEFGRRVHQVRADQWNAPTPCTDWDVRALVNHLTVEQLWVPAMLGGATVADVGHQFDGDQLGEHPVETWDAASAAALAAFRGERALEHDVHLSYGDRPASAYCQEMIGDLVVHGWDLARAIGADERLDPELVQEVYDQLAPSVDQWRDAGIFGPAVPVAEDADLQTRLLALTGRTV